MIELKEPLQEKIVSQKRSYGEEMQELLATFSIEQERSSALYAALKAFSDKAEAEKEEMKRQYSQLKQSLQDSESLSCALSHDLQTPLQAILGFIRMIEQTSRETLSIQGKYYFQMIIKNCQIMSALVQKTLTFAQVGRQEISLRPIKMENLVRDIFQEISLMYPERHIEWHLDALPTLIGDPLMFRQIWVNLLSNSFKFTKNQPLARIEVGCFQEKEEVVFFLKDNGAGFDREKKVRLFMPFQRLHSSREFEGTGIGLFIVKRLIARHGGRVWAEGTEGSGATFYFALPRSALAESIQ